MNKPFLKWAGSKRKSINVIKENIGSIKGRFIEPFVGAGSVFLNIDADEYILSDLNVDLIRLFKILQSEGKEFIKFTKDNFFKDSTNIKEVFYEFREEFNTTEDIYKRTALFVYLNRHAFNGLCRYNKSGGFNVPFGRYKKPYFPENEMINFIECRKNCTFLHQDFRKTFGMLKTGDIVYCDPPYAPISRTSNFTNYCAEGFNNNDQLCIVGEAETGKNRFFISNNYTEFTRDIYKNASKVIELNIQKSIGSKGKNRNKTKEILVIYNN